jgi:hypothetical protein
MKKFLVAALLAGAAIAPAHAATVDFSSFAAGSTPVVAGLTFSLTGGPSANGSPVVGYGYFDTVLSLNNSLVAGLGTSGYPTGSMLTIDFASAVSDVSFTFNNYGSGVGTFYTAYDAANAVVSTASIDAVNGFGLVNVAGAGIAKLVINNNTGGTSDWIYGVGQLSYGAVPEPATWAMMIGGFALVGASMRRRRTAVSFA